MSVQAQPVSARQALGRRLVLSDASGPKRGKGLIHRRERRGLFFVIPFLIIFVLFMIVPLGYAVYLSLYTTKLIGGTHFTGFANYSETLRSGAFWGGVARVAIYACIQIPVMLAISFFFATIFDLRIARFEGFFRVLFFVPFAVPAVVGSVMWSFLLEPKFGPFTHLAHALGIGNVNFFSSNLLLPVIIVIVIWEFTGYNMVIMYTALKSVPRDVVEASLIDGASLRKVVLRVKLPMVRPAIVMLVFLNLIGALQLFTEPLILSFFEPQAVSSSYTPTLYLYNTATSGQQFNLAAAGAVVVGLIITVISVSALIFRHKKGELA
jgi:multiple sugar transport system permease protein